MKTCVSTVSFDGWFVSLTSFNTITIIFFRLALNEIESSHKCSLIDFKAVKCSRISLADLTKNCGESVNPMFSETTRFDNGNLISACVSVQEHNVQTHKS